MRADDPIQFPTFDDVLTETQPRIVVIGAGGAGGNAVNTMIDSALEGVEFVAANTDAQALSISKAHMRLQLGVGVAKGLGAGANPEVGARAADESAERIAKILEGCDMCFIAAGMGGGTGTGAAPVIAKIARDLGVLTVGVVTKPFEFEGKRRMRVAEVGVEMLQQYVDTLIITPNQNLFRIANERTTFTEAFKMADDVLYQGVKGVTDLMVRPGVVNLDFQDVRAVMSEMGKAMMGSGEAEGEGRALAALEMAIDNPLLDEVTLKGARGVLINITGGSDLTLFEVDEAANRVRKQVDPDANVIWGSALDPTLEGRVRVSVVATGIDAAARQASNQQASGQAGGQSGGQGRDATAEEKQAARGSSQDRDAYDAPRPYRDRVADAPASRAETPVERRVHAEHIIEPRPAETPASAQHAREVHAGAHPIEPPVHAADASRRARPGREDHLVRKLAEGLTAPVSEPIAEPGVDRSVSDEALAQQASDPQEAKRYGALGFGLGGRDGARVEIPSFLRRQAT